MKTVFHGIRKVSHFITDSLVDKDFSIALALGLSWLYISALVLQHAVYSFESSQNSLSEDITMCLRVASLAALCYYNTVLNLFILAFCFI